MASPTDGKPIMLRLWLPIRFSVRLGDALSRLTAMAGIRQCGACKRRASFLNRLVIYSDPG
jgi:hypothetical protein